MHNPSHALRRELEFGYRDHILLAGHRHIDAYSIIANPSENFASHLCRVSGYKVLDNFAEERRFLDQRMNPSTWFLIDPTHHKSAERIKPFWDAEEAIDICAHKRRRGKFDK
jgi:hypothetical protein